MKRRAFTALIAAVPLSAGAALTEIRDASADANKGRGEKCQHDHQCASNCCRGPKGHPNGETKCRRRKRCK